MSLNMITNTVHCKVSFNGQIRRFALDCTEFSSLKNTIARLLSLNDEFVLKYLDDESDYVTLSNKEELKTALIVSPTLLRILVEPKKDAAPSTISDDCLSKKYQKRQYKDHEGKDHHGHHGTTVTTVTAVTMDTMGIRDTALTDTMVIMVVTRAMARISTLNPKKSVMFVFKKSWLGLTNVWPISVLMILY